MRPHGFRYEGLTPWLTGAGARSAEGTDIGHKNAEGMAYVGVRVEPTVRLGSVVEAGDFSSSPLLLRLQSLNRAYERSGQVCTAYAPFEGKERWVERGKWCSQFLNVYQGRVDF